MPPAAPPSPPPPPSSRFEIVWPDAEGDLRAVEPTGLEVTRAAPGLAGFYNDAHNRSMMAHEDDMTVDEVVEHYQALSEGGGRPFLLQRGGTLMGDADLRRIVGPTAEFAILVGQRPAQGKGLGTRFALMVHALAFERLGLDLMYVSIIPANRASQRLFEKLGYERDDSPAARAYADEDDDLTLSLPRERFRERHGRVVGELRIGVRGA